MCEMRWAAQHKGVPQAKKQATQMLEQFYYTDRARKIQINLSHS